MVRVYPNRGDIFLGHRFVCRYLVLQRRVPQVAVMLALIVRIAIIQQIRIAKKDIFCVFEKVMLNVNDFIASLTKASLSQASVNRKSP